jgi:hypothetical protein
LYHKIAKSKKVKNKKEAINLKYIFLFVIKPNFDYLTEQREEKKTKFYNLLLKFFFIFQAIELQRKQVSIQ